MTKKLGSISALLCSFFCVASACTTTASKPDDSASGGQGGQGGTPVSGGSGGFGGTGGSGGAPPGNAEFGLETRPANLTCKDPGRPTGQVGDLFAKKLSATGCFDATDPKKPAAGLIPYGVGSPLWSDNAEKHRWMALPEGKKIAFTNTGDFDFPIGTVLLKSFALGSAMLETRFLIRHSDGQWGAYTYVWDEAGKDATLQGPGSDSRFFGNDEWVFPSREDCATCHTEAAGRSLGPETMQFNGMFDYPMGKRANQLKTLDHIGVFATSPGDVTKLPKLPTPQYAESATLEQRARSYLHANCSHCHQPGGTKDPRGNMDLVSIDFRYETSLKMMNICNTVPSKDNYSITNVKLLTPGNTELSMISYRMHSKTPKVRMPQIGTGIVDPLGTQIVDDWIKSIKVCP